MSWRWVLVTIGALLTWTLVAGFALLSGWGRAPLGALGDPDALFRALEERIDAERRGNLVMALIEDGRVHAEHASSVGEPVDRDTAFQVASLSKWVTAWGVMALVDGGRLDLDEPVSRYLTRWQLPPGDFDDAGVTVRRLLSHTAGLSDGLGYAGFPPGASVQSLEESLTQAADPDEGASGAVRVGIPPGTAFQYSGGGYTLLQLLIEERSGETFESYMQATVFGPLGMAHSTFVWDDVRGELATFYDLDSKPTPHLRYTAQAAAALYTTLSDMERFVLAHVEGAAGEPAGRGVLSPESLAEMRVPHAAQYGADIWGLGTMLFAPNRAGGFVIGHDGNNRPAINTTARIDPATGSGFVALGTGNRLLATRLAGEWVFWQTGRLDLLTVVLEARDMLRVIAIGWAAIVLGAVGFAWRSRRL